MTPETATAEPPAPRPQLRLVSSRSAASVECSGEGFEPPRPLRDAVLVLVLLPLPVFLAAVGLIAVPLALGLGAVVVLLAALRAGVGVYDLCSSRRLGDALLRANPGLPPFPGLGAWRAAEVTSWQSRRELARLVRQLVREIEAEARSGELHDRAELRAASLVLLRKIESRLAAPPQPVSVRGMLALRSLALDGLRAHVPPERAAGLPAALGEALEALETA